MAIYSVVLSLWHGASLLSRQRHVLDVYENMSLTGPRFVSKYVNINLNKFQVCTETMHLSVFNKYLVCRDQTSYMHLEIMCANECLKISRQVSFSRQILSHAFFRLS